MKSYTRADIILLFIFILFFLLSGVVLLCLGVVFVIQGNANMSWQHVQGTIIESKWDSHIASPRQRESQRRYRAIIQYEYIISGKIFSGNRLSTVNIALRTKEEAIALCEKYEVGSDVTVYYDPNRPEKSVLIRGTPKSTKNFFIGGTICFLIGTGGTFFVVRRRKF